ncbi:MAG: M48 family metalloprotease [Pseudomonadota bacterium]
MRRLLFFFWFVLVGAWLVSLYFDEARQLGVSLPLQVCAGVKGANKNSVQYYIDKYGRASEDDAEVRRIYQVFDKVSLVADKRHHRVPKLVVYNNKNVCEGEPLAAALPDGYVVLSKKAVEILYKDSAQGDIRAAFVLGHELAHLANDDHWHLEFFNMARGNQSLRPIVNRFFAQNGEDKELQADDRGFIYAAMAGYSVDSLLSDKDNFFVYWQQQTVRGGETHPSLDVRAEALRERLRKLLGDLPYFHFGVRLSQFGRCDDGIYFFKEFLKYFPAREVYNNIGVCYLQRARRVLGEKAYFYWLPSVLDVMTLVEDFSLSKGWLLADDFFKEAKRYFDLALDEEPSYLPARVNLAITALLQGEIYEARAAIEKALGLAGDDLGIQGLRAVIVYEEGKLSPHVDMWLHTVNLLRSLALEPNAPLSIFYNLARLLDERKRAGADDIWQQLAQQAAKLPAPIRGIVCEKYVCPAREFPKKIWDLPVALGVLVEYDDLASKTLSQWQKLPKKGHRLYEKQINETIYYHPDGRAEVLVLDGLVEMVVLRKFDSLAVNELGGYCGQALRQSPVVNGVIWSCDHWAALVVENKVEEVWVVISKM